MKSQKNLWHALGLVGVLLLSVALNFVRLGQEGYGNLYYAATVKSMLTNGHNFFFASFDPGGFVTVDKPPLGFWIQAGSAALLGFDGWSLLLPQALAGVLSVALLYHLVRRCFGPLAGLLAALTLAVTPISVATNRNNTIDSLLILVLLLAAWAVSRAAERGRLRWLLAGSALVGLGFNVKMLQAYMVLPALLLLYLVAAPLRWWKRLVHLVAATALLLIVSLSWAAIVDLTPPDQRPFIGSSRDNTVMELIIGHNAMERLLPGGLRGLGVRGSRLPPQPRGWRSALPTQPGGKGDQQGGQPNQGPAASPQPQGQPALPQTAGPSAQPFLQEIGERGLLRLFNRQLAGQISWLLPLAALGLVAATWQTRLGWPLARRHQALLLWGVWLAPQLVFFSFANLFHRYYLAMLAPGIAALVGAGLVAMWNDYTRPGWRGWLLPLSLGGSALVQATLLSEFPDWSSWMTPLILALSLVASGGLALARLLKQRPRRAWLATATVIGLLALFIAPTIWSAIPVWHGGDIALPFAGPELLEKPTRLNVVPSNARLLDYLLSQHKGEAFLAATPNANTAAPLILATGEPVMALGGFSGGDHILEIEDLEGYVKAGVVRFFLFPAQSPQQPQLFLWIATHCQRVPPGRWQPRAQDSGSVRVRESVGGLQLFDCACESD